MNRGDLRLSGGVGESRQSLCQHTTQCWLYGFGTPGSREGGGFRSMPKLQGQLADLGWGIAIAVVDAPNLHERQRSLDSGSFGLVWL